VFYAGLIRWPSASSRASASPRATHGVNGQFTDLTAKRLRTSEGDDSEARRVVTFYSPDNPVAQRSMKTRAMQPPAQLELVERPVASVRRAAGGSARGPPGEADAFFFVGDAMVNSQEELIIDTTRAKRLPTMLPYQGNVAKGALASYGESYYALAGSQPSTSSAFSSARTPETCRWSTRQDPLRSQPQDRESARPDHSPITPGASGRDHTVIDDAPS